MGNYRLPATIKCKDFEFEINIVKIYWEEVSVCSSVCIFLRENLQLGVWIYLSPVSTTSWQRLHYIAIRLKHELKR